MELFIGFCRRIGGENVKVLQVSNFTAGNITILASVDGEAWTQAQYKDGSEMIFTPSANGVIHTRLDVGNYQIKAIGDGTNDGIEFKLF